MQPERIFLLFFFCISCLSLGCCSERINVRKILSVWKTGEIIMSLELLFKGIEVKIVKECFSRWLGFSQSVSHAAKMEFTKR